MDQRNEAGKTLRVQWTFDYEDGRSPLASVIDVKNWNQIENFYDWFNSVMEDEPESWVNEYGHLVDKDGVVSTPRWVLQGYEPKRYTKEYSRYKEAIELGGLEYTKECIEAWQRIVN